MKVIIISRILSGSWSKKVSLTSVRFIALSIGSTLILVMNVVIFLCLALRCVLILTICVRFITITFVRNINRSRRMLFCSIRWWRIS